MGRIVSLLLPYPSPHVCQPSDLRWWWNNRAAELICYRFVPKEFRDKSLGALAYEIRGRNLIFYRHRTCMEVKENEALRVFIWHDTKTKNKTIQRGKCDL